MVRRIVVARKEASHEKGSGVRSKISGSTFEPRSTVLQESPGHARAMFTRKLIPAGCWMLLWKREERTPAASVGVVARCSVYATIIINVAPFLLALTSFPLCSSLSLATAALRLSSQSAPATPPSSVLFFVFSPLSALASAFAGVRARSFPAAPLISRFVCAFKHRLSERRSKTRYRGKTPRYREREAFEDTERKREREKERERGEPHFSRDKDG